MDNWSRQVIFAALVITIGGGLSGMSSMLPSANSTAASYQAYSVPQPQTVVVSAKRTGAPKFKSVVKAKAASKSVAPRLFSSNSEEASIRTYAMN